MCLEKILGFKMKFIWILIQNPPLLSKVMIIKKLTMEICLVPFNVFYHIENQSKIILVYFSMEKSDQARF